MSKYQEVIELRAKLKTLRTKLIPYQHHEGLKESAETLDNFVDVSFSAWGAQQPPEDDHLLLMLLSKLREFSEWFTTIR